MQDYCCCSHCFFNLQRNRLFTSMPLGNNAGTEIRTRLQLRSTVRGANNRLDVDAIMSYDRGSNAAIPMLGALQCLALQRRPCHSIVCARVCSPAGEFGRCF